MSQPRNSRNRQQGVMLIEALIAILIFSIGILAAVGMQGAAIKNVTESRSRSEASLLAGELLAQMWMDQNINLVTGVNTSNLTAANYNYAGSGNPPPKLGTLPTPPTPPTGWIGRVVTKLPGANNTRPKVTITNPNNAGATVKIEIFWQAPEEATLGVMHQHVVMAAVQVSPKPLNP